MTNFIPRLFSGILYIVIIFSSIVIGMNAFITIFTIFTLISTFEAYSLYNNIKSNHISHLFFGARKKEEHFIDHNPDKNIYISTDDGSAGIKGNLFEAMKSIFDINDFKDKSIYVCGPPMMMEAVRKFSVEHDIECHLALETIMACGIGICQGCTVEKCSSESSTDTYRNKYELVCMDGPIYKANEVKTCLL